MTAFWIFNVVTNDVLGKVGVLTQVSQRWFTENVVENNTSWSVGINNGINNAVNAGYQNIVFSSVFTDHQVRKMIAEQQEDNAYSNLADVVIVSESPDEISKTFDDAAKTYIVGLGMAFTNDKITNASVFSL